MNEQVRPLARREGLIVRELEGELLVYDLDDHDAHCLNDTAARVWKRCDGQASAADIARDLSGELAEPVSEEVVWMAFEELWKLHLLEGDEVGPETTGIWRGHFIRRAGLAAAVALPVVTSLAVPSAASAVTCIMAGQPCAPGGIPCCAPAQCIGNVCVVP